jgi:hypothetical protein
MRRKKRQTEKEINQMGKEPGTYGMINPIYDYEWQELGEERGGPLKGIKEKILSYDPETGVYSRILIFEPGFRFTETRNHLFWEEVLVLEGHMYDYYTKKLYTKGCYGLRAPGTDHGPFGSDIGCTLFETTWYDKDTYKNLIKK